MNNIYMCIVILLVLISNFHHVVNVVFFLLGDSPASDFYVPMFRILSLFFHLLNKKNNWDEIARVFIQVKIYLKRSLGQLEWGRMGRGGMSE